jgi:hypothetical protein
MVQAQANHIPGSGDLGVGTASFLSFLNGTIRSSSDLEREGSSGDVTDNGSDGAGTGSGVEVVTGTVDVGSDGRDLSRWIPGLGPDF